MATPKTKEKFNKAGVEDLVLMAKVTEDQIVENLKKRYFSDIIYTNIGPVLISVNPYKKLPITGPDWVDKYKGKYRHELQPHIFALAEEAYRAVKGDKENQCVIISGESGAGKTEAAKLIMAYISAVSGGGEGVEYVKHVILESNPLLEAFGNAKTLRNNNSSRFGKYFEIHFNKEGDPCGGTITNYLLEKSRVVFQTPGERSFHIFYNLLQGASDAEAQEWQLYTPDNFHYLNQSQCYTVDGMNDAEDYGHVRHAMDVIGFSPQEQHACLQLVAAILHIGNISFVEDGKGNAQVADANPLNQASHLLQVEPFMLQNAILFRVVQTGTAGGKQSTYNVPQNPDQAAGARDALAKTIYDRMFDWIVRKVNDALSRKKMPKVSHIGVLDIFGFEIFQKNGFEQFCINYVNEKLQQYFIELTLKAEQEEYVREGIKWEPVKYFNNQVVCDLIEGKKPPGLFSLLDDVCYTVHAMSGTETDMKFLQKGSGAFGTHAHYRPLDTAFVVKHYAGDVTYEVEGFCDKNKDTLFNDIVEVMQASQNAFLASLFPEDTNASQHKRPTTAGFKIRNSAQALMTALSQCSPHYIRCIKPNDHKAPNDYDEKRVKHQVQYLGLLENVRVRRAGWAYRSEFQRFVNKYKKLSRNTYGMWGEWSGPPDQGCRTILSDMNIDQQQWQLGRTKVFVRHPETVFHLEECLERQDYDCVTRIQKAWNMWKLRKKALEQRAAAADLFRGKKERQRASVGRKFLYDYAAYADNFHLQEVITAGEQMVFCDQVSRMNRRLKAERRDLVITDQAVYLVMRQKKDNIIFYKVKSRTPLSAIKQVSVSTMQDNYFIVHSAVPNEGDHLLVNEHKTEIVALLSEQIRNATRTELVVLINDNLQFRTSNNDSRQLIFQRNESAQVPQLKKQAKQLLVMVATGLPRDTDTTPRNYANRAQGYQPRGGGAAGAARGGRGGASAPRGGGYAAPQQQQQQQQQQYQQPQYQQPAPQQYAQQPEPAMAAAAARPLPAGPQRGGMAASQAGRGAPGAGRGNPIAAAAAAGGGRPLPQAAGGGVAKQPAATGGRPLPQAGGGAAPKGGGRPLPAPGGKPGGRPLPAPTPQLPSAKALYDYEGASADELSFHEGDIILVRTKDPGGWWEGELNGQRGWVPANYVQEM